MMSDIDFFFSYQHCPRCQVLIFMNDMNQYHPDTHIIANFYCDILLDFFLEYTEEPRNPPSSPTRINHSGTCTS